MLKSSSGEVGMGFRDRLKLDFILSDMPALGAGMFFYVEEEKEPQMNTDGHG